MEYALVSNYPIMDLQCVVSIQMRTAFRRNLSAFRPRIDRSRKDFSLQGHRGRRATRVCLTKDEY